MLYSDLMYGVTSLIGAYFAFVTAYRAHRGALRLASPHRIAWLLVGVGLLFDSIGGFIYAYLEQAGIRNPEPALSDIGFTLFYPLVFCGLLCMPTTLRFRVRTGLDALILILCILGIGWFFAIGPTYVALTASSPDVYTFVVSLSYPFWDMLLILAIVLLMLQRVENILRPSLIMAGLGILCIAWADIIYAYFTALGTYKTGTPYIDPFWFTGSLLIGLSALYQYHSLAQRAYIYEPFGLDAAVLRQSVRERFSAGRSSGRRRAMRESTNIFRVLVKTLLKAGIITPRTIHLYAAWVDTEALDAEGDTMVGDAIAAEGIEYLRAINAKRRRVGQKATQV